MIFLGGECRSRDRLANGRSPSSKLNGNGGAMRIETDIHSDKDEFTYARRLLAEGRANRDDELVFTRNGKPCISATVGWWADHSVGGSQAGSAQLARLSLGLTPQAGRSVGGLIRNRLACPTASVSQNVASARRLPPERIGDRVPDFERATVVLHVEPA
jgi:hypothetical protein